jgi:uncharacterized protein (DUF4415 family)
MSKERAIERTELPAEVSGLRGWRKARHIIHPVTTKLPTRRVTINLDEDIVAIFKAEALQGGPPYQVAINQALRSFLRDRQQSQRERAVDLVLKALEDQTVVKRLRQIR